MENTGAFFEDDKPQWYVAQGGASLGPFTAAEVYQKVTNQELTWVDYLWKQGQAEWKRICDIKLFEAAIPKAPPRSAMPVVRQAGRKIPTPLSKKSSEGMKWFLFYNQTQFGPYSSAEIERALRIGKIHGRVHVWANGMKNWVRLETLDRFSKVVAESSTARAARGRPVVRSAIRQAKREQRASPRRPLVAKIIMASEDSVIVGVCRDISVGGMQVLTDRIPGVSGSRIKLNVSPSSSDAKMKIGAFVAEGVIVRILEDGRGFSFRFERLPDVAKKSIEHYIALTEREPA